MTGVAGSLSVAAFWRVLRTLGGKNIGKCRLRAHQHPLLPPLLSHCRARAHAKYPRQNASSTRDERVLGDVLRVGVEDGLLPASILDFKPKLENRCKVFPVYTLFRASILDFRARLGNRCKVLPVYALLRASILDFRARLGNRCKVFPVYTLFRASILDFRARLGNRCRVLPVYDLFAAVILDFRPRLANRCSGE